MVHDLDIVRGNDVVGVHDKESLVFVSVFVKNAVEAIIHDPAFALARQIVAIPGDGTCSLSLRMGIVCAGVANNKTVDQILRIVLREYRAHKVADYCFLIMGCNEKSILMLLFRRGKHHIALRPDLEDIDELIEVRDGEKCPDDYIKDNYRRYAHAIELQLHDYSLPKLKRRVHAGI